MKPLVGPWVLIAAALAGCGAPCADAWIAGAEGCPAECAVLSASRIVTEPALGGPCVTTPPVPLCASPGERDLAFACFVAPDGQAYWVNASLFDGGEGWRRCTDAEEAAAPGLTDECPSPD